MTMQALTLSVSINRNWKDLYDAIWRPEAFQKWASGMAESTLEPDGDQWKARGPAGDVTIRFTAYNDFGVMDHTVRLASGDKSGDEIHVPLRVFANGDGAEVTLTLFRQPGMSDDQFAADADWVRRDLATLAQRFST
ncbi:SRPBCC family protein [Caballeronia sp. BR00000012568055]|uniref:SRPBCC family protein n=1 Tax=Caballeronia sp. BR00000012568055 TaxID=2918761 RepID=UPI0027D26029|nr:SRPBCC family protein [Caballeronia sp. BR00000012568055]